MKFIRIFLLVLIVIGIGLLITQKIWVPKLVDVILKSDFIKYESIKYNFSFTQPVQWSVSDNVVNAGPEGIVIKDESLNEIMTISYTDSLQETSMQAPLKKRKTLREALEYELSDIHEISVGGNVAYEGIFTNDTIQLKEKQVWLENQEHIYTISLATGHSPEVDRLLASFTWLK
jgi:hypothetical protein